MQITIICASRKWPPSTGSLHLNPSPRARQPPVFVWVVLVKVAAVQATFELRSS